MTSLNALIDSGSPICFIKECYIPCAYAIAEASSDRFCGLNGSGLKVIGRIETELMFEGKKFNVTLRVVPDGMMQSLMVLGRDFLSMAKLSLKSENEVVDITEIEIAEDELRLTSRDMHINEDLSVEVKAKMRVMFDKYYVYAKRPPKPATENILRLTFTNEKPFSCTPRRLVYHEKTVLRSILDELIFRYKSLY